jgi:hypothetical protein
LKTRRLDPLACEEGVDGLAMDTQHASDANCIETTVVDEPSHCLRMDAELVRNFADAHKTPGFSPGRRHNPPEATAGRF